MKTIDTIEGARIYGNSVKLLGKKGNKYYILDIKISNGNLKIQGPFNKNASKSNSLNKICNISIENLNKLIKNYNAKGELAQDGTNLNEVDNYSFWEDKLYVLKISEDGKRIFIGYNTKDNTRIPDHYEEDMSQWRYNELNKQINRFNNNYRNKNQPQQIL